MDWLIPSWADVGWSLLSVSVIYVSIILYTRLAGLRSFSKMSAADFAMTVAVGSLFASAVTSPSPPLLLALAALAGLFFGQWLFAMLRRSVPATQKLLDNNPILLMHGAEILYENLKTANVTESDLMAKLREANAMRLSDVRAVIFETTGDISVLHASDDIVPDDQVMRDVVGWNQKRKQALA